MQLVIAEKPSVGQSISAVLKAKERHEGYIQGGEYIVTWCIGHLVELVQPQAYDEKFLKWNYSDLPINPVPFQYSVKKASQKQFKIIKELLSRKDVDSIICATDAGREGELIFRLVYEHCKCKKPFKRLWINSMEEKAIENGFINLKSSIDFDLLYQAALARSQADWLVGINSTRLFSVLYGNTLNIGRVMTPTLALMAERESSICNFIKEPFYNVVLDCGDFTVSSDRISDKDIANDLQKLCNKKTTKVKELKTIPKSIFPPKLYDLTTLQREANRIHGYTSQQTLDYAQSLYEKKLITYPRTDSRFLTEDMEKSLPKLVDLVCETLPFTTGIQTINSKCVVDNSKVTDHFAIIPTQSISISSIFNLSAGEKNVFNLIAVRLICAISPKQMYDEVALTMECENALFYAKSKSIVDDGWKSVDFAYRNTLKDKAKEENENEVFLPQLTRGQSIDGINSSVKEGFTSPPKHYTEDTLLSAMECAGNFSDIPDIERKGLGTPATRAGIIEKLVKTGFVERKEAKKVKHMIPTQKGINLITVLPETIKSPKLTANWESKLQKIETGELSATNFMVSISDFTHDLVKTNTLAKEEFEALFIDPTKTQVQKGDKIGICPRCGNNVSERGKGFFCENTSCQFALWKDNKFFSAKKKTITKEIAATLLDKGCIFLSNCYSEKTGKTYNATVTLEEPGESCVKFGLEFEKTKNSYAGGVKFGRNKK